MVELNFIFNRWLMIFSKYCATWEIYLDCDKVPPTQVCIPTQVYIQSIQRFNKSDLLFNIARSLILLEVSELQYISGLKFIGSDLQKNRHVLLIDVRFNRLKLEHASDDLRTDIEVILVALQ